MTIFYGFSTKSDGVSIYDFLLTIYYFTEFSTKYDGSAEQKSEIYNIFLFLSQQALTVIIRPTFL